MNPPVVTTFANPDPNAAPLDITELVALLNQLVNSQLVGSYIPYIIQQATPSPDDRDKAWIQLDSSSRPIATKVWYNGAAGGNWRRIYNGMLGQISAYNGNPNNDFDMTTATNPGKGLLGGNWDGWALCNGNNGTINLTDKFIIGGHIDNSNGHVGYSGGWQTFVDGVNDSQNGGNPNGRLNLTEAQTWRPAIPELKVGLFTANGNTGAPDGDLYGVTDGNPTRTLINPDPGNLTPGPVNILPPFIALGFAQFIGYDP